MVGRQENPFFATEMFWAPDSGLNGVVERIDFDKIFGWAIAGGEPIPAEQEGKSPPVPAPAPAGSPFELSLIAGQFIFFNNNADSGYSQFQTDAYQFETQLQGKVHLFNDRVTITWAPGVFVANNAALGPTSVLPNGQPNPASAPTGGSGVLGSLNNAVPFPVTQRDELFLLAPGEIQFKLWNIPASIFWDISYNVWGNQRFDQVYGPLFSDVSFTKTGSPVFSNRTRPSFSDNFGWPVSARTRRRETSVRWLTSGRLALMQLIQTSTLMTSATAISMSKGSWNLTPNLYGGFATSPSLYPVANSNSSTVFAADLLIKF